MGKVLIRTHREVGCRQAVGEQLLELEGLLVSRCA